MTPDLSGVALAQRRALERLRNLGSERAMLDELVQTSCLLELSKLASASLDLATFAEMAVDIIFGFFMVDTCAVVIEAAGLPAVSASAGRVAKGGDAEAVSYPLGERNSGSLTVTFRPSVVESGAFFARAAEQLSAGLESIVEAERLRRQAAAANAMRMAASLHDITAETSLAALVQSMAALPNALGAKLAIDHPVVGAPLELVAGATGRFETERRLVLPGGEVGATVQWASQPQGVETALFDDVLHALAESINRSEQSRQLREQLEVDPLTGVGNRRRGARALAAAIGRAERHAEAVSVLALDLDHFKEVNDRFGHAAGDTVLQLFAGMLAEEVRPYDTVVRTGGEEFLIICPTIDAVGARALAARLRDCTPVRCAEALPDGPRQTVSIGIAVYPEAADYP
ncbi:MAG: hypothetical protein QOG64_707, partial [Acidimicrobiaceae bacterium]|nr:hypothetical protein [Acidimicrobiaceae bacterium]